MIVDILNDIAQDINLTFAYGDKPSLNLKDETIDERYCLWLLPVENKPVSNEFNRIIENNWDIAFFICIRADMDGGNPHDEDYYFEKWSKSIKPIYDNKLFETIANKLTCEQGLTLSNLSTKEVINLFDENMDGLYITFTIKEDLI